MIEEKRGRLRESLLKASAEFVSKNSPEGALVTVTNFTLSDNLRNGQVLISVIPDKMSTYALKRLEQQRGDFSKFVKNKTKSGHVPHIDFVLDETEELFEKIK